MDGRDELGHDVAMTLPLLPGNLHRLLRLRFSELHRTLLHPLRIRPRRQRRQAKDRADRGEGAPINGAGAELRERRHMLADRIALVLGKAVSWTFRIQLANEGVGGGLGQDGGGGDRRGGVSPPKARETGALRWRDAHASARSESA